MVELLIHNTGCKFWYLNNKRHRADGPAIVWDNTACWYWHNRPITEYEHMMLSRQEKANG